jgi:hypothetical protein
MVAGAAGARVRTGLPGRRKSRSYGTIPIVASTPREGDQYANAARNVAICRSCRGRSHRLRDLPRGPEVRDQSYREHLSAAHGGQGEDSASSHGSRAPFVGGMTFSCRHPISRTRGVEIDIRSGVDLS